jgi:hypothetical protein
MYLIFPITHLNRITPMGRNYSLEYFRRTGRSLSQDLALKSVERLKAAWEAASENEQAEFMVWAGWLDVKPDEATLPPLSEEELAEADDALAETLADLAADPVEAMQKNR